MPRNAPLWTLAVALLVAGSASASVVQVVQGDPSWTFFDESSPPNAGHGVGGYAEGKAALGEDSVRLQVDAQGRVIYGTSLYSGTRLDAIEKLSYATYRESPTDPANVTQISLQLDVDFDVTDDDTSWQGRLIFEPYQTSGNRIVPGQWQVWQPLAGRWWASGAPGNTYCPQASPCTLAELLGHFPDVGIREVPDTGSGITPGFVWFRAGGPWDPFVGYVDMFTIAVGGVEKTYDFERFSTPVTIESVDEHTADFLFYDDDVPVGTGAFSADTAALGNGSVRLGVDDNGRSLFGTDRYAGTFLRDLEVLRYASFRSVPADESSPLAPSLQLQVDYDATDADQSWQGRLVFEPYQSASPSAAQWEIWNALDGVWWASGAPGNTLCPQADPCTWDEVLFFFPNAAIQSAASGLGQLWLKVGGPWAGGWDGYVDMLTVAVHGGAHTVFDFEQNTIFADGFESGDLTAWTVP